MILKELIKLFFFLNAESICIINLPDWYRAWIQVVWQRAALLMNPTSSFLLTNDVKCYFNSVKLHEWEKSYKKYNENADAIREVFELLLHPYFQYFCLILNTLSQIVTHMIKVSFYSVIFVVSMLNMLKIML